MRSQKMSYSGDNDVRFRRQGFQEFFILEVADYILETEILEELALCL